MTRTDVNLKNQVGESRKIFKYILIYSILAGGTNTLSVRFIDFVYTEITMIIIRIVVNGLHISHRAFNNTRKSSNTENIENLKG